MTQKDESENIKRNSTPQEHTFKVEEFPPIYSDRATLVDTGEEVGPDDKIFLDAKTGKLVVVKGES